MTNGIQFDEIPRSSYDSYESNTGGLVEKIITFSGGIIKTRKQAEYVLIVFSVLVIIFSFTLFFGDNEEYSAGTFPVLPAEQSYAF